MFTGLIESVGRVETVTTTSTGMQIAIATALAGDLQPGESVSVNGVCLTATRLDPAGMHADIGPETARVTTLGRLRRGDAVNLERSMRADSRFGGHFVQGHVDAVGHIEAVRPDAEFHTIDVRYPDSFAANVIQRGSIAVDGISLTIAALNGSRFGLMIIP